MTALYRSLARLSARRPLLVLGVAAAATLLSALLALRIEVKTSLADTMSDEEPVARLRHLAENLPGAVTVQVVLDGNDPARLVEVAHELGILACLVVTLFLLPALIAIFDERLLRPREEPLS